MKKIMSLVLVAILAMSVIGTLTACGTPRGEILKIYNWGEYMDDTIYEEFEQWYFEQTKKKVKVVASEFLDNETMMTKVERNKADYDLICPSDYAVERMIDKGLAIKVDKKIIDIEEVIKKEYIDITKVSDSTLEYAVPFMYGTYGIMYDYSKTKKHIDSWDALFTNEYNKKITQKDSVREAFSSAGIYNAREELSTLSKGFTDYNEEYQAKLQSIFEDASTTAIAAAKETLIKQKGYIYKYDREDVKFSMAAGNTTIEAALMWSCDAGYVMKDYEDADGNEKEGNKNLWYVIPKEGGNVYIDSFIISKYAKNVQAANYFLAFLCQKEIAVRNSEYIGAISPVEEAYDELYASFTEGEELTAWDEMWIETMFPSAETLKRCGVMKDFGANALNVDRMWSEVTI